MCFAANLENLNIFDRKFTNANGGATCCRLAVMSLLFA